MPRQLSPSRRLRRTPFSEGVEAAGATAYTVYNHMLLPTVFRSMEEDYRHLKEAVQVWDVACERQIRVRGPDALALIGRLTPRDISGIGPERCLYIPVTDRSGGMLNDPVLLQPAEDTFWISIADSDLLLWVAGVAAGAGLDVEVDEPDVSPLAVQGPRAEDLLAAVLGDGVRDLKFFGCGRFAFGGTEFLVARSGYSKQGGFEIYVEGAQHGMPFWEALFEAGARWDVRAGGPNLIERIEGGLLSYGNDMTRENSPLECGLNRYVSPARLGECFGGAALAAERERGSARGLRPIEIGGDRVPVCDRWWPLRAGEATVGRVSSAAFSPDHDVNVAIGMVEASHWEAGTELEVVTQEGVRPARLRDGFWA